MLNKNQLDLEECISFYSTDNLYGTDNLYAYISAFQLLYNLDNPCGLLIMLDSDLEELFIDSNIEYEIVFDKDIKYGDDKEIINIEEGEIIGQMILTQENKRYVLDAYVGDNGCILSDGYDFFTIKYYE